MGNLDSRTAAGSRVGRKHPIAGNSHLASVAATTLLMAVAGAGQGHAAGETIGYSAPFLMAQFEVILQDQTVAAAKAAGLDVLSPTNADQDSGKQITDVRNLIGAGAKGLIVVANDSKAIIPALDFAVSQKVPVVSIDIGPDGGKLYAIVRADNRRHGPHRLHRYGQGHRRQGQGAVAAGVLRLHQWTRTERRASMTASPRSTRTSN